MRYTGFKLSNYKGIRQLALELPVSQLGCLLGLNESGKTTILDGIDTFSQIATSGNLLTNGALTKARPRGASFTGNIVFEGTLALDDSDREALKHHLSQGRKVKQTAIDALTELTLTFTHTLKNSQLIESKKTTSLPKIISCDDVRPLLPDVLYYDDFVFDVPPTIEFIRKGQAPNQTNNPLNQQWRLILNDVYRASPGYDPKASNDIQADIVDWSDDDNVTVDQRVLSMQQVLNTKIAATWKGLSKESPLQFNQIVLKHTKTPEKVTFKLEIHTSDGRSFSVNERSKGCKWFFSFLLFTEFRKHRTNNALFLLDEPASNMHASAQEATLKAIEQLCGTASVLYATHSPYMLDMKHISSMLVVTNRNRDELENNSHIDLVTYSDFYLQKGDPIYTRPALDHISFRLPSIELRNHNVFVEGTTDWKVLWLLTLLLESENLTILPGQGASNMSIQVAHALVSSKPFLLLLDNDQGAKDALKKYKKTFGNLLDDHVKTLGDIDPDLSAIESLFCDEARKAIADITSIRIDDLAGKQVHKGIESLIWKLHLKQIKPADVRNQFPETFISNAEKLIKAIAF